MRTALSLIVAFCLVACGPAKSAGAEMRLTSSGVGADGRIAARHSDYGQNLSPPLSWTAVAAAKTYAILLEDPDAPGAHPFVHWLIWNIPGAATALPEGVPTNVRLEGPRGALQGANEAGGTGYFGPKPPSGVHHYRFEIFALDSALALAPGADRQALVGAMRGHILAKGELPGTFAAPGAR